MLTVRENIRVAADIRRKWSRDTEDPAARTDAIIDRIGLRAVADVRVTALPTGQGRLVELGRALACKPTVLLLDEPASGQDETETEQFARLLRELADEGIAVVLVEHDVQLVMDVCDVISVLDFGRIIATGTAGRDPDRRSGARRLPRRGEGVDMTDARRDGRAADRRDAAARAARHPRRLRQHRRAARRRPRRPRSHRRRGARPERRGQDDDAQGGRRAPPRERRRRLRRRAAGSTAPGPTSWPGAGCASSPKAGASSRT